MTIKDISQSNKFTMYFAVISQIASNRDRKVLQIELFYPIEHVAFAIAVRGTESAHRDRG
jgi:hypothetical protein